MTNEVFKVLKKTGITDTSYVNGLFVSAFVYSNGLAIQHCSLLLGYLLAPEEPVLTNVMRSYDSAWRLEDLIELFEYVLSPSDRVVTGAVYTPKRIRNAILSRCLTDRNEEELKRIRVADISCGCGGFLMDLAQWIHHNTGKKYADIFRDNIFGIDVQEYSIERTKILLSLLALCEGEDCDFDFSLLCCDTLDFKRNAWDSRFREFDVIVGNPPYVCSRNLSSEIRGKLQKYEVCRSGHPDLYIPFMQIAVEMLKENGFLGYITMNTFIRSVNGRALRQYFSNKKYDLNIVDFRGHQIFESCNTYTCLFYLDKGSRSGSINYSIDLDGSLSNILPVEKNYYARLDDYGGWRLNKYESIAAFEKVGIKIKDYCPSRHGIATLSNETYIFHPELEDEKFYYLNCGGEWYPIEKGICRNVLNPNKLNSTLKIGEYIEKLIFPYNVENNRAVVIDPDTMHRNFPQAWIYLNAKRKVLLNRDKGNTLSYPQWYAFGRSQSLVLPRYKLFFPKFANHSLSCIICDDPNLMLYNGLAFVNTNPRKLRILKKVMESTLFWEYVQANAKPYASGYYSLSGVDIKHFCVPVMTLKEEDEFLLMDDKQDIEEWLKAKYMTKI